MRIPLSKPWAFTPMLIVLVTATAQKNAEKFDFKLGKISAADFQLPADAENKDAGAYIIADIGSTEFRGNAKGWFSLEYTYKTRVLINKSDGIDAADFSIPLYHEGQSMERVVGLKAASYSLENGQVKETSLDQGQVFSDKLSRNWDLKKFSVPGAKAGSIIEVKYTIESDYIRNLQPWEFQGKYPVYWSQYTVAIPGFFDYTVMSQGYQQYHQRNSEETYQTFNVMVPSENEYGGRSETVPVQDRVVYSKWVMKNVPAFKEEPFTTSADNHVAKIEFQLSRYQFKGSPPRNAMASWTTIIKNLNEDEQFGYNLYKNNNFLSDEARQAVNGATSQLEKAKNIYTYLQTQYNCTATSGYTLTQDLKHVGKIKSGNVADINLLLISMLNQQNIKAVPVILSTRGHGFTHMFYPLLTRYNYVVARTEIDGKPYLLDASEKMLSFGQLPGKCYNGYARALEGDGYPIVLAADSVTEKNSTFNNIYFNEKNEAKSLFTTSIGAFESLNMRKNARENGEPEVIKKVQKWVPEEYALDSVKVMNLANAESAVKVEFHLTPQIDKEQDVIYIRPFFGRTETENPFAAGTRSYPVEMPYAMHDLYVCTIAIPEGFVAEEIPKSSRIEFNDDGVFEYLAAVQEGKIMMRSRLHLKKANFPAEEYPDLREFFGHVVKKYSEQVVLKKKANP